MKITDSGEIMEDYQIPMFCEHPDCTKTNGRDYKRKIAIKGWEGEPIYLCNEHSEGFELIITP